MRDRQGAGIAPAVSRAMTGSPPGAESATTGGTAGVGAAS